MDGRAEPGEGGAARHRVQGFPALEQIGEAGGLPGQDRAQIGHRGERLFRRRPRQRLTSGGQERPGIILQTGRTPVPVRRQPPGDAGGLLPVRHLAAFQRADGPVQPLPVETLFGAGLGFQPGDGIALHETGLAIEPVDRGGDRGLVLQHLAHPAALGQKIAEPPGQIVRPAEQGELGQIVGEPPPARRRGGQNPVAHPVEQGAPVAILDHLEMGRHAGLQRKALEQRLAEGMDGLDAHAGRHIEAGREQGAGARHLRRIRPAPDYLAQVFAQFGLVPQRPRAQIAGDAPGHLRRRRPGEGQAQDARRRCAVQQQPQDAPGQHPGLAGAGAGADPGGDARPRGPALGAPGGPVRVRRLPRAGVVHPAASASAHSRMRARCS